MSPGVGRRKADHLRLVLAGDVESRDRSLWHEVNLVHEALPECDLDEVDTETRLLGWTLRLPMIINSMTGGHQAARDINRRLAHAAQSKGVAMGVGSQRVALKNHATASSFSVVRKEAPDAVIFANIGAAQLIPQDRQPAVSVHQLEELIGMVRADALAIHLDFTMELVQPEGDRYARGCLEAISEAARSLAVPVIAKETGQGIGPKTASRLREAGVALIDVGGAGGTSFPAVEAIRARERGDTRRATLGDTLRDWGIPTAAALLGLRGFSLPLVASGGIRSGMDAAKALVLGATAVGVARPLLHAAHEDRVSEWMTAFEDQLRAVMFLTGAVRVADLPAVKYVLAPELMAWDAQLSTW